MAAHGSGNESDILAALESEGMGMDTSGDDITSGAREQNNAPSSSNARDQGGGSNEKKGPRYKPLVPPQTKLPRIYFASRTHSQIAQLIGELKSTSYRPSMSILGSRDHYCIHKQVSKSKSKNEDCKALLEFGDCRLFRQIQRIQNHTMIQDGGEKHIWDIEDLVKLGEKTQACPYFASRALADDADIVFCPYNYIIDPGMRLVHVLALNFIFMVFVRNNSCAISNGYQIERCDSDIR
jgi:Rad3-related DNA helicase